MDWIDPPKWVKYSQHICFKFYNNNYKIMNLNSIQWKSQITFLCIFTVQALTLLSTSLPSLIAFTIFFQTWTFDTSANQTGNISNNLTIWLDIFTVFTVTLITTNLTISKTLAILCFTVRSNTIAFKQSFRNRFFKEIVNFFIFFIIASLLIKIELIWPNLYRKFGR